MTQTYEANRTTVQYRLQGKLYIGLYILWCDMLYHPDRPNNDGAERILTLGKTTFGHRWCWSLATIIVKLSHALRYESRVSRGMHKDRQDVTASPEMTQFYAKERWGRLKRRFSTNIPGRADRLQRCQLSSPASVINFWWSAAMLITPTVEICIQQLGRAEEMAFTADF